MGDDFGRWARWDAIEAAQAEAARRDAERLSGQTTPLEPDPPSEPDDAAVVVPFPRPPLPDPVERWRDPRLGLTDDQAARGLRALAKHLRAVLDRRAGDDER